jgi:hypothetical protein
MEVARLENITYLLDKILAHLIIYRSGEHTRIILEPDIVTSREVQLRNQLKAHTLELVYLFLHSFAIPRALNRYFGMGLIAECLSHVDYKGIDAREAKIFHMSVPAFSVKKEYGGGARGRAMLSSAGISLFIPHVRSEMDKICPHKVFVISHFYVPFLLLFICFYMLKFYAVVVIQREPLAV